MHNISKLYSVLNAMFAQQLEKISRFCLLILVNETDTNESTDSYANLTSVLFCIEHFVVHLSIIALILSNLVLETKSTDAIFFLIWHKWHINRVWLLQIKSNKSSVSVMSPAKKNLQGRENVYDCSPLFGSGSFYLRILKLDKC